MIRFTPKFAFALSDQTRILVSEVYQFCSRLKYGKPYEKAGKLLKNSQMYWI
jgi:hypothetical protein